MKIVRIILIISLTFSLVHAQNTEDKRSNKNPFPIGIKQDSPESIKNRNAIPKLIILEKHKTKILPVKVDNSKQVYFRPIFNQGYFGSCAQSSGIAYAFTYEINCARGLKANTTSNQYPAHYTWNFLNDGVAGGSFYEDGWSIAIANGIPSLSDCSSDLTLGDSDSKWISGYNAYYNGMHNRIDSYYAINAATPSGLETLKQWLYDHGNGSSVGGVANFSSGGDKEINKLPGVSDDAGMSVVTEWNHSSEHAMTFVGYNDNIKYDINGDGQYTNDIDINNDGVVDMQDWEIGGLIVANSYGNSWGDEGLAYMMYYLLARDQSTAGGISHQGQVFVMKVKENYSPKLTMKVSINHSSRDKIKITAGVSTNINATVPEFEKSFTLFNYQGGDYPFAGENDNNAVELGLDITSLLTNIPTGEEVKFFLNVYEADPDNKGNGTINNFSIIDYTSGTNETVCSQTNVSIDNNTTTRLTINKTIKYGKVDITTTSLPDATQNQYYSQQLSASDGTLPYKWNLDMSYTKSDISSSFPSISNTELTPSDYDDGLTDISLPFSFPFYGKSFTNLSMNTNGYLSFEEINSEGLVVELKVAPFDRDLTIHPSNGEANWYQNNGTSATFRWKSAKYGDETSIADVAVKLFNNGEIEFYYQTGIDNNMSFYSGVFDGRGSRYTCEHSNTSNLPSGYKYKLTPGSSMPAGLSLSEDGLLSGTPTTAGVFDLTLVVKDVDNISTIKTFSFTVKSISNSIKENVSVNLAQNYPNPFTGETHINFLIKTTTHVKLEIYNSKGEKISTLIDEERATGHYTCSWNKNNKFESGIYFYKLTTENNSLYKKMILIK